MANEHEFCDAITRHGAAWYRAARRRSRTAEDAEDALQDALLSAYTHLDEFQGRAKLSSWMTRIVINSALGRLRQNRRPTMPLDPEMPLADTGPDPEQFCYLNERRARLERLLDRLPPKWRTAVRLRNLDGLSTREAAQVLGIPEATLKTRLHRAHLQLARWLQGSDTPVPV